MARNLFAEQPQQAAGRNLFAEQPQQPAPEGPSLLERGREIVTGEQRMTPEIAALPEIGDAPEIGGFGLEDFKTAFGLLSSDTDEGSAAIIKERFPEAKTRTDEKGNVIVDLPSGSYAINRPGLSAQDVARGIFTFGAYSPAGRAGSVGRAAAGSAATEVGLEGIEQAAGGEAASVEDVLLSGLLGGAFKGAEDLVGGAYRFLRGKIAPEAQATIQAGERAGVPVMTSDVIEPQTLAGKISRSTAESVPFAGTGQARAAQQEAREAAVERFTSEFTPQYDEIVSSLKRQTNKIKSAAGGRLERIGNQMEELGPIQPNRAIKAIDDEISDLTAPGRVMDEKTVSELQRYRQALEEGQTFKSMDTLRSDFRESVKGDRAVMPTRSQAASEKIYREMTKDLTESIESGMGKDAAKKWSSAKAAYGEEFNKLKKTGLKNILDKGDLTPERAGTMLFSQKPSDIRNLYRSLDAEGKQAARSTVISKAVENASKRVGGLSPNSLSSEIKKLSKQTGIIFKGEEKRQLDGFAKLLESTRRAQEASVTTPTGQQLLGGLAVGGAILDPVSAITTGVSIGALGRLYESKPVRDALLKLAATKKGSTAFESALSDARAVLQPLFQSASGISQDTKQPQATYQ